MTRGFFRLFAIRGTAFRVHWSAPRSGTRSMRRYGMRVLSIDVHALGGVCHGEGSTTPVREAIIAWGGIVAQLFIGAALTRTRSAGMPTTGIAWRADAARRG